MLLRVTAWIFCLLANVKTKDASRQSWNRQALNAVDLQKAENVWIRFFQHNYLAVELKYLQGKNKAWRSELVSQLDLFLDEIGVIWCKGRLQNTEMSSSAKYSVLIPKNSVLAWLLITSVHERICNYAVDSSIGSAVLDPVCTNSSEIAVSQMYKMSSRFRTILSISCSLVISGSHSRTKEEKFQHTFYYFLEVWPAPLSRIRRRFDSRLFHQCSSAFHWSLSSSMLDLFRQCIDVRERFQPFTQTL